MLTKDAGQTAASQLPDCCAEGGTVTVFLQEAPLDGNPYCQPARVTIASCGFFSKSYLRAPSPWAQGGRLVATNPTQALSGGRTKLGSALPEGS